MKRNHKNIINIFLILLVIFSFFSILFKITHGIETDEEYFISMIYKLNSGGILLTDFYEPHQFSCITPSIFLKLKYFIINNNEMDMLYLRVIGLIFCIGVSYYAYQIFKKEIGIRQAIILSLLILLFTPKFTYLPDYAYQQYLCLVLLVIFYFSPNNNSIISAIRIGIVNLLLVLAYPPMVIITITYYILLRKTWNRRNYIYSIISFIIIGFLLLLTTNGIHITDIGNIFSDETHTLSIIQKIQGQWYTAKTQLVLILVSFLVFIPLYLMILSEKTIKKIFIYGCITIISFFSFYILICSLQIKFESKWVYLVLVLIFIASMNQTLKWDKIYYLPILSVLIAFVSSNQGLLFFLRYGFIFFIIYGYKHLGQKEEHQTKIIYLILIVFFVMNNLLITTNHFYSTMNKSTIKVESGILSGISIDAKTKLELEEIENITSKYDGTFSIVGNSFLLYAAMPSKNIIVPTTQSTPVYNEQIAKYVSSNKIDYFYIANDLSKTIITSDFESYIKNNFTIDSEYQFGAILKTKGD